MNDKAAVLWNEVQTGGRIIQGQVRIVHRVGRRDTCKSIESLAAGVQVVQLENQIAGQ
jgi:hypothetical protein